jgi:hypothetical protein
MARVLHLKKNVEVVLRKLTGDTPDPTTAARPPGSLAARNATATIIHLQAQVPHDAKRATKTALKKHNQAVDRTYNASVKKRRTETCLDLGAPIILPEVVITLDVHKPPCRGTKRKRATPVALVMPIPLSTHPVTPAVPQP